MFYLSNHVLRKKTIICVLLVLNAVFNGEMVNFNVHSQLVGRRRVILWMTNTWVINVKKNFKKAVRVH